MKIKLIILLMALGLGANAQYVNVGANGVQRQIVAGDSTFRWNLGTAGFLYGKSLSWYRSAFAPITGGSGYIWNQSSTSQTASSWISGVSKAGGFETSKFAIDDGNGFRTFGLEWSNYNPLGTLRHAITEQSDGTLTIKNGAQQNTSSFAQDGTFTAYKLSINQTPSTDTTPTDVLTYGSGGEVKKVAYSSFATSDTTASSFRTKANSYTLAGLQAKLNATLATGQTIGANTTGNAATATTAINASTVTNGVYTTGNQSIAGVKKFTNRMDIGAGAGTGYFGADVTPYLDIASGDTTGLVVGADNMFDTRTANATKAFRMSLVPYNGTDRVQTLIYGLNNVTDNVLNVGGGTLAGNSSTLINFYTAANKTTVQGVQRASFGPSGLFTILYGTDVSTGADASIGSIIRGFSATQSADLLNIRNSANANLFTVSASGASVSTGSTYINSTGVSNKDLGFSISNTPRWIVRVNNTAESGSNAGSDFEIIMRSDAGANLGTALNITRSTGLVNIPLMTSASVTASNATVSTMAKFDSAKKLVSAVAGTDYVSPTTGAATYGTKARITASGTGIATTITYAHGLSGVTTSSWVSATANNAASAGISYVTVDATLVSIVYTVAPAAGTGNLIYSVEVKP